MKADSADDRELQDAFRQISLLDSDPLPELTIDYKFEYRFTCDGQKHEMKIHDWEVQAAYHHFKRRYGNGALEMLKAEYQTNIPARHLHLVMGTMKAHPRQFIIIGLLRSNLNPADALRQPTLLP